MLEELPGSVGEEEGLPAPRLQHVSFRHGGHRQAFHRPGEIAADFK